MAEYSFPLRFSSQSRSVRLREMNGHDELIEEGGTFGALRLLNGLMSVANSNKNLSAEKLAVPDRDFLLSRVYKHNYGPQIQSSIHCKSCNAKFDLSFRLDDLISFENQSSFPFSMDNDGYYPFSGETRFKLPTGEDELAVSGLPIQEAESLMVGRCIQNATRQEDIMKIQELMEKAAPFLFVDISARCPECEHQQSLFFDMQSFLLKRIQQEKRQVTLQVHCIASQYHWSHKEILDLPRSLRQQYVRYIGYN